MDLTNKMNSLQLSLALDAIYQHTNCTLNIHCKLKPTMAMLLDKCDILSISKLEMKQKIGKTFWSAWNSSRQFEQIVELRFYVLFVCWPENMKHKLHWLTNNEKCNRKIFSKKNWFKGICVFITCHKKVDTRNCQSCACIALYMFLFNLVKVIII